MTAQLSRSDVRSGATATTTVQQGTARRTLRMRAYCVLAVVDTAALAGAVALANLIRFDDAGDASGWNLFAVLLPLFLALSLTCEAYSARALAYWRNGVASLLGSLYLAVATVVFISFYLKSTTDISRIMLSLAMLLATILLPLGRFLVGRWTHHLFNGVPMSRVLITDGLSVDCPHGVRQLDAAAAGLSPIVVEPMLLDRLTRMLDHADEAIVACAPSRREAWAMALKGVNVHGEILVPELDALGGVSSTRFGGMATMLVASGPLRIRDQIMKRMLDLVLAGAAVLFLAPLLIAVAIAIKLDSAGPVFFVQQRVGYKSRLFDVFKFRSMRAETSDGAGDRSTARDDDRITRVGRFIRATSIDELPQLFNILRGEMSFVGPRPHALGSLAGDQLFWEVDPRYLNRHACKPGLTGLAQIRGFRGATHKREDLVNRLHADLEYVNGWSILRDLSIMIATVKVVVHRNAF